MLPIKQVYPEFEGEFGYSWGQCPYQPLLNSFCYVIAVQVDDDAYHGDSRILFQDGERYGVLLFGWGSCSGCDALHQCETYADLEALQLQLFNSIRWGTAMETLTYIAEKDWSVEPAGNSEEMDTFLIEATKVLTEAIRQQHEGA